jgi:prepilin-type N-terminal cleavage/methylation domain-containing protein
MKQNLRPPSGGLGRARVTVFPVGSAGFTLIEMLVVILIILILAGLLLGGINVAMRKAESNKAQTTAFQLANACRSYQSEYGVWPCDPAVPGLSNPGSFSQTLVDVLTAQGTGAATNYNPRRIVFLEPEGKSIQTGACNDPWGAAYRYLFDTNYVGGVVINGSSIPVGVVVWSYGSKGATSPTNDWVKTW